MNFFKSKWFIYLISGFVLIGIIAGIILAIPKQTKNQEKLLVYTSFYPLYEFATKVGGEKVEVINLVAPGQEPHHFELETDQLVGMANADLIIINGVGFENWISKLNAKLLSKILDTSIFIELLPLEEHDHEHEEHEHNKYDPHYWLNPQNAKLQMQAIKNKFIELDPQNAKYYEKNFKKYSILFDGLTNQFNTLLSDIDIDSIVVAHPAFSYMLKDYNIKQVYLTGIYDENEPSITTLTQTIEFIKNNNIKVIFYQTFINSKVIQTIAENCGKNIEVDVLHTIEGLSQKQIDAGENYFTLMAENLSALANALKLN